MEVFTTIMQAVTLVLVIILAWLCRRNYYDAQENLRRFETLQERVRRLEQRRL